MENVATFPSPDADAYLLEGCPARFDQDDLDRLLAHAVAHGASDIHIQSHKPVLIHCYGRLYAATPRAIQPAEASAMLSAVCGDHALGTLAGGKDVDSSYSIRPARDDLLRFRVNATACLVRGQREAHITIRVIPTVPPRLDTMKLPSPVLDAFLKSGQGLVLITGPTGSGKTTLMASVLSAIAVDPDRHDVILTYESPIEYVYDHLDPASRVLVAQSEVGRHVPSWAAGIRNSLRRAPTVILVGESRDTDTMSAALLAALTGHLVFTTLHTNGVAETLGRIARMFEPGQRHQIQADLFEALRLVLTQRLVPSLDGKRVALREYLVVDGKIRAALQDADPLHLGKATRNVMDSDGHTMISDAQAALDRGAISELVYQRIVTSYAN